MARDKVLVDGDGIFTGRSIEHLGLIATNEKWKVFICQQLKREYDLAPAFFGGMDIEVLPGGYTLGQLSPADAPRPAMVPTGRPELTVTVYSKPNQRRQEILEHALRLGCEWALKATGCKKPLVFRLPYDASQKKRSRRKKATS